jgi:hypothetical protein
MTEIVAGWYPDPAGSTLSRWWDGTRWTESTMAPNSTSGQVPYQQAPYGQQGAYQYGQAQYNQPLPYSGGPASVGSLWQSNRYTLITVAVAIAYALLGLTTHVVLIGIVPILFAVRAFRAREKLAVLAAAVAGLSVVVTIILVSGR